VVRPAFELLSTTGPMRTFLVFVLLALSAVLLAPSADAATLVSIALSPSRRAIAVGDRVTYHAVGQLSDGTTLDVVAMVTWNSSDTAVASIDSSGHARGLAAGATTIQATDPASGIISAGAELVVAGIPTKIKVTPKSALLPLGGTASLKASATFAGVTASFNVTSRVQWNSSDPMIASVDEHGVVTCLDKGTAEISAEDTASGVSSASSGGSATVNCGAKIVALKVTPTRDVLATGATCQMRAFLVPDSGPLAQVTDRVTWSSNSERTASVIAAGPKGGLATALRPGRATIIATDPVTRLHSSRNMGMLQVPGSAVWVKVYPKPLSGGTLTGSPGSTLTLTARVAFAGGVRLGASADVNWSSSNPDVVTVSNGDDGSAPGQAQLVRRGSAVVTITYPKTSSRSALSDSVMITVH